MGTTRATQFTRITCDGPKAVLTGSYVLITLNVANPTGSPVTLVFTTNDGLNTAMFSLTVGANSTEVEQYKILMDKGLRLSNDVGASVILTAWHSAVGA